MDSLSYLQEKLSHLQQKYPHRSRYCALRMMITSMHALFMRYDKNVQNISPRIFPAKDSLKEPCIVFSIKGGLGDLIIACNYIYCFYKYVDDPSIKLKIQYHSKALLNEFCKNLPGVVETDTQEKNLSGTLGVELNRFPRITAGNSENHAQYNPRLGKLLHSWQCFFTHNRKFFDMMPRIDGLANNYAQLLGNIRLSQADIGGLLNIGNEFEIQFSLPSQKRVVRLLNKFHLRPNEPFITIQRGQSLTEKSSVNNKLWPITYYHELVRQLKQYFPHYKIVQLGTLRPGFEDQFPQADVNLLGKTNLQEVKVLLKCAALHIDCEGGLVHLRHALKGGPSVVLFGPTSPAIYGYKENLNLRSTVCPQPCEWITDDWISRCPRREDKHICMRTLTPQFVFEEIKKWKVWQR